ncbi:hypothetical protein [Rhizobium sp. FKY42]|uniref:hypothetical protein n=1 Tax=Rhizobium sp. FKY42 TaxID=2562310 RepID=UPI0014856161|nr:hypothetical protein [Rhizobium sp. FKY42]
MMARLMKHALIVAICLTAPLASAGADTVWGSSPNSIAKQSGSSDRHGSWKNHRLPRNEYRFSSQKTYHYQSGHQRRDVVAGNGLPSYVRGIGTFAGGLSAVRFRGNGIYFFADGIGNGSAATVGPGAKIITVSPTGKTNGKSACAMEHGVCVVRGSP